MKGKRAKHGVTLIELLITTTIVSFVGLAIYGSFAVGVKVWQRGQKTSMLKTDTRLALTKMAKEIRNSYTLKTIQFKGDALKCSFPGYVRMIDSEEKEGLGIGEIKYFYDDSKEEILRMEKKYHEANQTFQEPKAVLTLANVKEFKISYYKYSDEDKKYMWVEEWIIPGQYPLGIKFDIKTKKGKQEEVFSKTVFFPVNPATSG